MRYLSRMLSSLIAFTLVAALLTIAPGPDVAIVLRMSFSGGFGHGFSTALGISLGCALWGLASALGITGILAASNTAYTAVRVAGALYLCYLGVRSFKDAKKDGFAVDEPASAGTRTRAAAFRSGLLANLLNPKVGIFYISLLPTFLPRDAAVFPVTSLLVAVHIALGLIWLGTVSFMAEKARHFVSRRRVQIGLNRTMGTLLLGFGLATCVDTAAR